MDAQVLNEGRHQGGRAPYGYVTADGGEHPNPRKAAEGYRLRVLAVDPVSAQVVRRIFAEYLDGKGNRAIANGLNRDGVPCPSARRPDQNRHRLADGWQGSTIRSILENPRYTGYTFFGRWTRQEMLRDPDDVAAGHVTRFRGSAPTGIVRSRYVAHPTVISVETFTQAQLIREGKAVGGLATARKADRGGRLGTRDYALRGLLRCSLWRRKMQGQLIRHGKYYRCTARTMAPGAGALVDHPRTVNLREDTLLAALNGWISGLFAPESLEATVDALVESQEGAATDSGRDAVRARLVEPESRLRRHQSAIAAGVEIGALVDVTNQTHAECEAARAQLAGAPSVTHLDREEVRAMIDSLGDVRAALTEARPPSLARLYSVLGLQLSYRPDEGAVYVTAQPHVDSARVRGGT